MSGLSMKTKKGTVIHRTTSETLRLGDNDLLSNHAPVRVSVQSAGSRKKSQTSPSCSFQITGVSLTRCDLGDDSADDLDESHTDDISRVTDNETPSFSEDSRDTDEHLLQPSQQQVDPEARDLGLGRFKVVKIESVAPFSRGRWTCFDYLDHSENATKGSYVYGKHQFIRASQDEDGATNPSNFWEPHCQEYLYHAGTMILPHPLFVPARPTPKAKARTTACPIKPSPAATQNDNAQLNTASPVNANVVLDNESTATQQEEPDNKDAQQNGGQAAGASVSCTATIDTKIEHALDVVKNHLTHAVRLEVEELKVKINELVDRISYLEYENDLLRANVAPDVLATLGDHRGDK